MTEFKAAQSNDVLQSCKLNRTEPRPFLPLFNLESGPLLTHNYLKVSVNIPLVTPGQIAAA